MRTTATEHRPPLPADEARRLDGIPTRSRELRSFRPQRMELRETSDGRLHFVGYAAVWNAPSEGLAYRERILRDAFTESLAAGPDVRLLLEHQSGTVIARTTAGTLTLTQDDIGLRADAYLDPTDVDVQRIAPKLRAGHIDQMSFAFWIMPGGEEWVTAPDGVVERHLRRLDIDDGDVAIVTYPAYPATTAELRARQLGALTSLAASRSSRSLAADLSTGNQAPDLEPIRRATASLLASITGPSDLRSLEDWTTSDLVSMLYDALDRYLNCGPGQPGYWYYWIDAVSDEWFVYVDERPGSAAPGFWQVPFTITADGVVAFGTPVAVIPKRTYLPAPAPDPSTEPAVAAPDTPLDDDEMRGSSDTPSTMTVRSVRLLWEAQQLRQGATK